MQTTEYKGRSGLGAPSSMSTEQTYAQCAFLQPYRPSRPQVLTDDLKAQLAASNQQRRACLYPGLVQALTTTEPGGYARDSYSEERAMSLQQLAAANKARRNKLRETGYVLPVPVTA